MRVGAAKSEGIDADQFRTPPIRQAPVLGDHLEIEIVEGNVGIRRTLVQGRGNEPPVEGHDRLQQTGQTRYRLEMAHVGFHRADGQGLRTLLGKTLAERIGFDGIADPRAGSVRFDEARSAGSTRKSP